MRKAPVFKIVYCGTKEMTELQMKTNIYERCMDFQLLQASKIISRLSEEEKKEFFKQLEEIYKRGDYQ